MRDIKVFAAIALAWTLGTGESAAFVLAWHPASDFSTDKATRDANLGINPTFVEDFDDATLAPGLTALYEGAVTSTVRVNASEPRWGDSDDALISSHDPTNQLPVGDPNGSSGGPTRFLSFFLPFAADEFGVGFSAWESSGLSWLEINGGPRIEFQSIAGWNLSDNGPNRRNRYLTIDAGAGESISEVAFAFALSDPPGTTDGFRLDYLTLGAAVLDDPDVPVGGTGPLAALALAAAIRGAASTRPSPRNL